MRIEKFTQAVQGYITDAQSLAVGSDHAHVTPVHLLQSMLDAGDPTVVNLIKQAGGEPTALQREVAVALDDVARLSNHNGEITVAPELQRVLAKADVRARKFGDEFIAQDQLLAALAEDNTLKKCFDTAGVQPAALDAAIKERRAGQPVTDANEDGESALAKYTIDLSER
ncbi:MAG: Clp protease N-terminal domain-containing protein, partial [Pseudomonadales bacterium]